MSGVHPTARKTLHDTLYDLCPLQFYDSDPDNLRIKIVARDDFFKASSPLYAGVQTVKQESFEIKN